jgi:gliding motility-associated-like protein
MKSPLLLLLFLWSTICFGGLDFIENQGQFSENVFFVCMNSGVQVGICADGLIYRQTNAAEHHYRSEHLGEEEVPLRSHTFKMQFVGSSSLVPEAKEWDATYYNFFIGEDESSWRSNVPAASKVLLPSLYEGIDLLIYSVNNRLKYDFIVHPGADPSQIAWEYIGVKALLGEDGDLVLASHLGDIKESSPFSYQMEESKLREVSSTYRESNGLFMFSIGEHNPAQKVVIDPEVIWSTYLDEESSFYSGFTSSSTDKFIFSRSNLFAAQWDEGTYIGDGVEVVQWAWAIHQMNADGSDFDWSTYLGSGIPLSGGYCFNIAEAGDGSIYLYGQHLGPGFPITINGQSYSGVDRCLALLSEDGNVLLSSTYFFEGMPKPTQEEHVSWNDLGSVRDLGVGLNVVNSQLALYYSSDVPSDALPNAITYGDTNALHSVLICFDAMLEEIQWCTEFGGANDECELHQFHSFVSSEDRLFLAGRTECELPYITEGGFDEAFSGSSDGFFVEVDANSGELLYTTYVGEAAGDELNLIAEDNEGNLWLAGRSESHESVNLDFEMGDGRMFFLRLNEDLTAPSWYGRIGHLLDAPEDMEIIDHRINSMNFDSCGRLVASTQYTEYGVYEGPNSNVLNFPLFNSTLSNGTHYFFSIDLNTNQLHWSDYYGGGSSHFNRGFRFHGNNRMYFGTCTEHIIFGNNAYIQATPGAYSEEFQDYLITNITLFDFETGQSGFIEANPTYSITSNSCSGAAVSFEGSAGAHHYWSINGDSLQGAEANLDYLFDVPGIYEVQYTVEDSSSCNIRSTSSFVLEIPEVASDLDFAWDFSEVADPCVFPQTLEFEYTGSGADALLWELPDGEIEVDESILTYVVDSPGNYLFSLQITDGQCDSTITNTQFFDFYQPLAYNLEYSISENDLCEASTVDFELDVLGADALAWTYENEVVSENSNFSLELAPGVQTVYLDLQNTDCNQQEQIALNIEIPAYSSVHDVFVPNVFTPNGNAENEYFQIKESDALALMSNFHVQVLNRWGQLVFESTDPYFKWDGEDMSSAQALPDGVYFYAISYKLDCSEELFQLAGELHLFR